MKPGTKAEPTKLKILKGNPGKRCLNSNEPEPGKQVPKKPEWVTGYAEAVWKRLADELNRIGLLTVVDRDLFAAYCISVADLRDAEHSGDYKLKRDAIQRMRMLGAEFGLTPSARSGIIVNAPRDKKDSDRKKRLFG
jgi:phage terminase small subunit